jgi:hypothetical protein
LGLEITARVVEVNRFGLTVAFNAPGGETVRGVTNGRFFYNTKLERPFIPDDNLAVIITSTEGHSISVCPTREYVRPLIIIDINGVLGEREKFVGEGIERRFTPRPHAREFLSHCSTHFEIALWTCATPGKKSESDVFPGGQFVFDWNQTQATNMWPRTSCVSSRKPLFFKELSKVWKAFPCFDASNTLLIDDHVEKFERNPEGTCMVVPQYRKAVQLDTLLMPGNKLSVLLDGLIQSSESFQVHCKDLVGKHEFFEPHPKPVPVSSATVDAGSFLEFLESSYPATVTESDADQFRLRFLDVACLYKKNVSGRLGIQHNTRVSIYKNVISLLIPF